MVFKKLKLTRHGLHIRDKLKEMIVACYCASGCQVLRFTYFPEENKNIREVFIGVYPKHKHKGHELILIPEQAKEIIKFFNEVFNFNQNPEESQINQNNNIKEAVSEFCKYWALQVIAIGNSFNSLTYSDGCKLQNEIIFYLKKYWTPKDSNEITILKLKKYIEKQLKSYEELSENPHVDQSSLTSKINTYQHILTIINEGIKTE